MDMEKFIRNAYGLGGKSQNQEKSSGEKTVGEGKSKKHDLNKDNFPESQDSGIPESPFFSAVSRPVKNDIKSGFQEQKAKPGIIKEEDTGKVSKFSFSSFDNKSGENSGSHAGEGTAGKNSLSVSPAGRDGNLREINQDLGKKDFVKYNFNKIFPDGTLTGGTDKTIENTMENEMDKINEKNKKKSVDDTLSGKIEPKGFYKVTDGETGQKPGDRFSLDSGEDFFEKKGKDDLQSDDFIFHRPFTDKDGSSENYRRVAKFLILIGEDKAAKIMSKLTPEQAQKIAWEIATIRGIDRDEASAIFAEFNALAARAQHSPGGIQTAKSILEAAFGKERAEEILKKSVHDLENKPFDFLSELDTKKVLILLNNESVSLIALVMTQIPPALAASVIEGLPDDKRKAVIQHLAKMQKVDKEVISRVDRIMREKAKNIDVVEDEKIDGRAALAEILRQMDSSGEEKILRSLNSVDSELEKDMRNRMFTIQDLIQGDSRWYEKELRKMSDREVALLINGKPREFRKVVLNSVSRNRASMILEEEELMKKQNLISHRERESVYKNFLSKAKKARDAGEFIIDDSDFVV